MENVKKLKFSNECFFLELLRLKKRNMVIKKLFYSWINLIYTI